jgi:DMSO/TMAO reductase YedYZ molybdopterin-dependent catalytic subunit
MARGAGARPVGPGRRRPRRSGNGRVAPARRDLPDVSVDRDQAHDRDTLLALELDGEPLALDHGFPLRLIAPNRPGVQQTKWINKVVVS